MSLLNILPLAGSAISAQSQRLNTVASNLANADTVAGPDGLPYKARQVVFQATQPDVGRQGGARVVTTAGTAGVRVSNVVEDQSPGKKTFDPKHPSADAEGYVMHSNVNVVEELVNMIQAQRAYELNSKAITVSDQMLQRLGQL